VSAGDLAAVVVSVVMIVAIVALAVLVQSLLRTLGEARATLERVRIEAMPLMGEMRDTVERAGIEVDRVDDLLETAESISATVESASRLGYLAFRAPVIRVVAFGRGVGRGTRALTGRSARIDERRSLPRRRAGRGANRRSRSRRSSASKRAA
jgi:hypothetical protein